MAFDNIKSFGNGDIVRKPVNGGYAGSLFNIVDDSNSTAPSHVNDWQLENTWEVEFNGEFLNDLLTWL